uniref:Uncharacterized protein n=1 Tax=Cacopsylla melanoneura TaxID=428564 RepID=A0A8D9AXZ5_9HEMI
MFDWLAEFTESDENSDQMANKVLSLIKANHSVIDYYLNKTEKTTRDPAFTRFNVDKLLATMENIHLYYNMSDLRNKDRILDEYILKHAYKQVTKPIRISEILSTSAKIFTTIVDTTVTERITTLTTTTSNVEQVFLPINNTVNDTNEDSMQSRSNKFLFKIKKFFCNFKRTESTIQERSTKPQATLIPEISRSRLKKIQETILKSKVGKKCQRLVNNIAKLKKGMLIILRVKQTTTKDEISNKNNNSNDISQGTPNRHRRDVSNFKDKREMNTNESSEKSRRKSGFFDRIKKIFWKNDNGNANTEENSTRNLDEGLETIRTKTSLIVETLTESKSTNKPFTIVKWYETSNQSPKHLNLSTALYSTEFSNSNIRTREHKFSDNFNMTRKQDILLENAKKFLQDLCNTTKPIAFTKMKDFIAGLSTKSGQEWWEALAEHEDSQTITTVPTVPDDLWKLFQKSLKVTAAEFSYLVTEQTLSPNYLRDCNTGSIPSGEKSPYQKNKTKYKYESWRGISKEEGNVIKDDARKFFEHYRCTSKAKTRKKDEIQTSRNITQSVDPWKFILKGLENTTTRPTSTIFNLEGRTFYRTQSAVFTYKKKTSQTSQQSSKTTEDDVVFLTDDPKWYVNRTFDYEYFNELMRASLPPEYQVFFTDKFTTPQPTIKKSMFQMIKNIFRGGKSSVEVKRNKTESEEDFEHYKYLCNTYEKSGNITKEEFEKRKLGNIQIKWN